jgi:glutathione S-transferase
MSLVVLGANASPFVRKVRVFLAEKGLDYELQQVNPFAAPAGWREISPLGKIPAFKDGDRILNDSSVICAYLERRFSDPALYPSEAYEYARALWFEEFADGGLVAIAGPKVFLPLVLKPLFGGKAEADPEDEAVAEKTLREDVAPLFDYLEREIGEKEFLVGGRLTIADVSLASPFVNLRHAGVAPERTRWPRLRAYVERLHARPAFAKLIAEEAPLFGKRTVLIKD